MPAGVVETPFCIRMTPVPWWTYPTWELRVRLLLPAEMSSGRLLALVVTSLLAAGLLAGCGSGGTGDDVARPAAGQPATTAACPEPVTGRGAGANLPDLALPCLGRPGRLSLRQLPARPVVLNLWASWCGPCREEMPALQRVYEAAGGRVLFLGVATRDGEGPARGFVGDFGVTYPSLYDERGVALGRLGAPGLPLTLVLGPDGALLDRTVGGITQARLVGVLERAGVRLDRAALGGPVGG